MAHQIHPVQVDTAMVLLQDDRPAEGFFADYVPILRLRARGAEIDVGQLEAARAFRDRIDKWIAEQEFVQATKGIPL